MQPLCLLLLLAQAQPEPTIIRDGLAIQVPRTRRSPVHVDPVEAQIVAGTWKAPQADTGGWTKITAGEDGWFQGRALGSGYVYANVQSDRDKVALLEASGSSVTYVNSEPRAGDPYQYGYVSLPVQLKKGANDLLFLCGRGRLRIQLVEPPSPVSFDLRDPTLPDLTPAVKGDLWGAVVVRNATTSTLQKTQIISSSPGGKTIRTEVGPILPLSVRKVGFRIDGEGSPNVVLRLMSGNQQLDRTTLTLRQRKVGETYKRTFVSDIDGSVQYYGVNPSSTSGGGQALFLSLHGASVEAIGQADAYGQKSWGYLVAPTNRRPFGFDWEDMGRLDALEVLRHAQQELRTDPRRTYLTGHSMGGHGTWQLGAHYPNLFAGVAPSAGWISFWTYAGGQSFDNPNPIEQMLLRAAAGSDTLALKNNFRGQGIYILHGDADDNVPVTEARKMREELAGIGADLHWHEQKGAGHWWDDNDEPGASCVDWPAMFDLFARRSLPLDTEVRNVDFTTVSPGISATMHWVTVENQEKAYVPSRVVFRMDPLSRHIAGTTTNVTRLSFTTAQGEYTVEIDGQKLTNLRAPIRLEKHGTRWVGVAAAHPQRKNPLRYGTFKDVFRNRVVFVYGTAGTPEENEWAKNKARFDAESFWYRGNGSVDIVPDAEFDPAKEPDRNVLLYGNSRTNRAWGKLLPNSTVTIDAGSIKIGEKSLAGADLACTFIHFRPGSNVASVGAIGGTGLIGMRLTDRLPILTSGAGFPDVLVVGPEMLEKGVTGVRAIGFLGMDWRPETGEIVWRE